MTATLLPTLWDTELGSGESTLDDLIVELWEGLAAHRPVRCPVCDGSLTPVFAAHARPVAGRCRDCGTTVS